MKVEMIAATHWQQWPSIDGWNPEWDAPTDAELLIEFAGRNCYQSWHNPAGRTNAEYIENILKQGHGSVLEHASATFYITGVSRSLTHELIRHRHLSFSELSQRFVNVEDAEFVKPPLFQKAIDMGLGGWSISWENAVRAEYVLDVSQLQEWFPEASRKQIREAARCSLPNCTETKIVVTGNFRAWRQFIEARGGEHVDAEIRQLACEIARQLSDRFPAVFGDCVVGPVAEGVEGVTVGYSKV